MQQQFALLNLGSANAAPHTKGASSSAQNALGVGLQTPEIKGDGPEVEGFAPVLSALMQPAADGAPIDAESLAKWQQLLDAEGGVDLTAFMQQQGFDPQALMQMSGQDLADMLAQQGIFLPPEQSQALIDTWDSGESPGQRLAGLLGAAGAVGDPQQHPAAVIQQFMQALLPGANNKSQHEGDSGKARVDKPTSGALNLASLPLGQGITVSAQSAAQGPVANASHAGSPWLIDQQLHVQAGLSPMQPQLSSTSLVQGDFVLANGDAASSDNSNAQWRASIQLSSAQAAQNGAMSGETDNLFRAQLDLSATTVSDDVGAELAADKSPAVNRLGELQARQAQTVARPYSTAVNVPVTDPQWSDQVSQKIVWMTGRQIQTAEIHLNPPELGPVDVKISVSNDQATVSFNAQHASVREMLEANVQRLREMMESNGVALSDVNVGSGERDERYAAEQEAVEGGVAGADADSEPLADSEVNTVVSDRLVDFYA
ncbi:MAG: flagellar hook-length control protein FliK [Oleiphilaceae bacterium]|nr:flagellar hook-length control protein FliK [Oleiphilaceae bacterium]